MRKEEKLDILNKEYSGDFRLLTVDEVEKYTKILNHNNDEWIEPYAVREETGDIISTCDNAYDSTDFLFSKIYKDEGIK